MDHVDIKISNFILTSHTPQATASVNVLLSLSWTDATAQSHIWTEIALQVCTTIASCVAKSNQCA